jgi:hypothetical protein
MTQLPHAFKRIRLELARSKEFPNGSANHGYEFIAPLDVNGHVDAMLWQQHRENCRVSRFWGDGEEIGYLLHKPDEARFYDEFMIFYHDARALISRLRDLLRAKVR